MEENVNYDVDLSRRMCAMLRYGGRHNVPQDGDGWAKFDNVVDALRGGHHQVSQQEVLAVAKYSTRDGDPRFELSGAGGEWIRATSRRGPHRTQPHESRDRHAASHRQAPATSMGANPFQSTWPPHLPNGQPAVPTTSPPYPDASGCADTSAAPSGPPPVPATAGPAPAGLVGESMTATPRVPPPPPPGPPPAGEGASAVPSDARLPPPAGPLPAQQMPSEHPPASQQEPPPPPPPPPAAPPPPCGSPPAHAAAPNQPLPSPGPPPEQAAAAGSAAGQEAGGAAGQEEPPAPDASPQTALEGALRREIDALRRDNEALRENFAELRRENIELRGSFAHLQHMVEELSARVPKEEEGRLPAPQPPGNPLSGSGSQAAPTAVRWPSLPCTVQADYAGRADHGYAIVRQGDQVARAAYSGAEADPDWAYVHLDPSTAAARGHPAEGWVLAACLVTKPKAAPALPPGGSPG